MRTRKIGLLCGCVLMSVVASAQALANPPSQFTVTASIYEVPGDTNSTLKFKVSWSLEPVSVNGNDVGWEVVETTIMREAVGPNFAVYYRDEAPDVDTTVGLWWVTHADIDKPTIDEFLSSPTISGVAVDLDENEADLNYSVTLNGESTSGAPIALATYTIQAEGDDEPEEDDDDGETPISPTPIGYSQ